MAKRDKDLDAAKKEAVSLHLEEQWSYPMIMDNFDIKSASQIMNWIHIAQKEESFKDYRGKWTKNTSTLLRNRSYI